jgi:hypothetical protein
MAAGYQKWKGFASDELPLDMLGVAGLSLAPPIAGV